MEIIRHALISRDLTAYASNRCGVNHAQTCLEKVSLEDEEWILN